MLERKPHHQRVVARGKDQRKTRRVETAGLTVLSRYEYESAIDQDGSRTRLTNIRPPGPPALTGGLSHSRLVREHFEFARYPASVSSRTRSRGHVAISCQAWIGKSLKYMNCSPVSWTVGVPAKMIARIVCIASRWLLFAIPPNWTTSLQDGIRSWRTLRLNNIRDQQ
jgi:hypothetical protein